ncbi:hypothetical protein BBD41_23010 [Paenibacillus ihbetae]|uniref:Uncharacterized protein n=1 Tax=Paenibacillus ihbetae TaxID=1870820 RepID=A0A1B2E5H2_9BACL|nr:hypothetical protein [Paenibacillus ihbetae]ANY75209.1 hypothetical protein BBD41_23010 [Paenibacillus ihbetae]
MMGMSKIQMIIEISSDSSNKLVPLLRKYTGLGITDIKNRLDSKQSLLTFNSLDEDDCKVVNTIIARAQQLGGEIKLLDEDFSEELSLEHFRNLQNQHKETSRYLQDISDLECSKIRIQMKREALTDVVNRISSFTVINHNQDHIVMESEYSSELMELLQKIVDHQVDASIYQVEMDQETLDAEDKVSAHVILDTYKKYFE